MFHNKDPMLTGKCLGWHSMGAHSVVSSAEFKSNTVHDLGFVLHNNSNKQGVVDRAGRVTASNANDAHQTGLCRFFIPTARPYTVSGDTTALDGHLVWHFVMFKSCSTYYLYAARCK